MPDKDIEKNLNENDGKTDFKGLNSQPEYQYVKGGYYITLLAKNGDKVNNEMPLFITVFK